MVMTRSTKAALLLTVRTNRRPPWWHLVYVITNFMMSSIAPWRKSATSFRIFRPPSGIFRPPSPSPSRLWHQSSLSSPDVFLDTTITQKIHIWQSPIVLTRATLSLCRPNNGVSQWCLIAQRNDEGIVRIKNLINDTNSNVSTNASSNVHCHYVRKYRYIIIVSHKHLQNMTSTQNSIRRNTCYEYDCTQSLSEVQRESDFLKRQKCSYLNIVVISWRDKEDKRGEESGSGKRERNAMVHRFYAKLSNMLLESELGVKVNHNPSAFGSQTTMAL